MRLNQVIALANGKKANCTAAITEIYKTLQKPDLFGGLDRRYHPLDDEGEKLPPETKIIQQTVQGNLDAAQAELVELLDVIATQEFANCEAKADIVVDDQVLAKAVPVTYMLFLEKQVDNIKSLISKLPVLSSDVKWHKDPNSLNTYMTETVMTTRTKKLPIRFERSPATDKHPAQVDVLTEDKIVGNWHKIDSSGAVPAAVRDSMLKRAEKLREALKVAREEANSAVVTQREVGKSITNYVFAN